MKNEMERSAAELGVLANQWRLWAFPVAAGLFVALSLIIAFIPQLNGALEDQKKIPELKEELGVLSTKRGFLESLNAEQIEGWLGSAFEALPNAKPVFEGLGTLNRQAEANKVVLIDYTINPGTVSSASATQKRQNNKVKPGMLGKIDFDMTIQGNYEDFILFIKSLETSLPLIDVQSIAMDEPDAQGIRSYIVEFALLYSALPAEPTSLDTPLSELTASDTETLSAIEKFTRFDETTTTPVLEDQQRENPFIF